MAFVIRCSFAFEHPLVAAGVPVRRPSAGRNVPMYARLGAAGSSPGDVPVFWACGVTPQAMLVESRPELAITMLPVTC